MSFHFKSSRHNKWNPETIRNVFGIYRGYSIFWNEYAIYFIKWSEKWMARWQKFENSFYYIQLWNITDFLHFDVIHDRTWRHIRSQRISCLRWHCKLYLSSKAETTGAAVKKMKISTTLDNLIKTRPKSALDLHRRCTSSMCEQSLCKVWI